MGALTEGMSELHHFLAAQPGGPAVLLQDAEADARRWLWFHDPVAILVARRIGEVLPVLAEIEDETRRGRWAAGFLSYEAAPALDPALAAFEPGAVPLAWWGIFEPPRQIDLATHGAHRAIPTDWRPAVSRRRYRRTVERIHAYIAQGSTYQVNYTFPLESPLDGDPKQLFATMCAAQQARYCAWVDTGRLAVCSASPELFFALDGERIISRPMKGTARRGRYPAEDSIAAAALAASEKERAENLMIVDMVRNDLGKIAAPGSVAVDELFTVETYPTVHQLTSTVHACTRASYSELLRALFPSASITGAPKVSTSRIIRELEIGPRGVYTGAIGFFAPERRARLNVAIRTVTVDRDAPPEGKKRETAVATYGTGGGIVWDSGSDAEYRECRAKALVLSPPLPELALLETLLWCPPAGATSASSPEEAAPASSPEGVQTEHYFLLDRHLDRLLASARYFDIPLARAAVLEGLEKRAAGFEPRSHRVRLLAHRDGRLEITAEPWSCSGDSWTVALDDRPVDDADPLLFHKTTARRLYDQALRRHPGADEVVLWNVRGELTEATRANLVLKLGDRWLTPPVACGLLAGTYRAELLARGRIHQQTLAIAAFEEAEEIWLINSLRRWIRALPTRLTTPVAAGAIRGTV